MNEKCSHCGFPLIGNSSSFRHYGTSTAHQEDECLRLLKAEIDRLKSQETKSGIRLGDYFTHMSSGQRFVCTEVTWGGHPAAMTTRTVIEHSS